MTRRALLSVYDKTGLVEFARGLHDARLSSSCRRAGRPRALADAGLPVTTVEDVTGVARDARPPRRHAAPEDPRRHPRRPAARSRTGPTSSSTASSRSTSSCRNLYPFLERPDIETIDIGGPTMVRAAAKNHAWRRRSSRVPTQYDAVLDELRANDGALSRRDPPRARARGVRAHRGVRRRDRASGCRPASSCRATSCCALDRTDEQLRYGENPHQQAARYRVSGTTSWWDGVHAAQRPRALVPQPLRHRRRLAAGARPRRPSPACAIIKHANPCGVAVADDLATAYQRALECDERSAFGGIVALQPADRRRDRRAHGRRPAGRRRDRARLRGGHARRAAARSARTRACSRRRRPSRVDARLPPDLAAASSCSSRTTSRRAATTGGSSPRCAPPTSSGATPSSRGGSAGT